MSPPLFIGIVAVIAAVAFVVNRRQQKLRREAFIRNFKFPQGLFEPIRKHRPDWTLKECQLVTLAMRHFFLAYLNSGQSYVSMPSQAVDELWHEFILNTRVYTGFCQRAFGQYLHHTPAVAVTSDRSSNEGLRRIWWYACKEDGINPRKPTRLPLLFAIDSKLKLADGFHYVADCEKVRKLQPDGSSAAVIHCGSDFGRSDFQGESGGSDTSFNWSNDSWGGGDGGGDGGGGCGGGGCGS